MRSLIISLILFLCCSQSFAITKKQALEMLSSWQPDEFMISSCEQQVNGNKIDNYDNWIAVNPSYVDMDLSSIDPTAEEQILNGDMEDVTNGVPDNWIETYSCPISADSTIAHSGKYSLKATMNALNDAFQTDYNNYFMDKELGRDFCLQAYVMVSGATNKNLYFWCCDANVSNQCQHDFVKEIVTVKNEDEWYYVNIMFTMDDISSGNGMQFYVASADSQVCTVWLDDVSLKACSQKFYPTEGYGYLHFKNTGDNTVQLYRKFSSPINLTNYNLYFDVYTVNGADTINFTTHYEKLYDMWVYFYNGERYWKTRWKHAIRADGWHGVGIHKGSAYAIQSDDNFNWGKITKIMIEVTPKSGQIFEMGIDNMKAIERFPYAFVTHRFDDGYTGVFYYAKPVLDKYGAQGAWVLNTRNQMYSICDGGVNQGLECNDDTDCPDALCKPYGSAINVDYSLDNIYSAVQTDTNQLLIMEKNGWDIGSHTHTHLTMGSYANGVSQNFRKRIELLKSKRIIESMGLRNGTAFFTNPYSGIDSINTTGYKILQRAYKMAFSYVTPLGPEILPFPDRYFIGGGLGGVMVERDELLRDLTNLKKYGGWGQIMWHNITNTEKENYIGTGAKNAGKIGLFKEVCKKIHDMGIFMVTYSDMCDALYGKLPADSFDNDKYETVTIIDGAIHPQYYLRAGDAGVVYITTNSNNVTIYLPPEDKLLVGCTFTFKVITSPGTNTITIDRNGARIESAASNFTSLDTQGEYVTMSYVATSDIAGAYPGWAIIGGNY